MSSVVEARRFTEESPETNGIRGRPILQISLSDCMNMEEEEEEDKAMPD
jgi:hypothetical protein